MCVYYYMQIYIAKYLKKSYLVGRCEWKKREKINKNKEYFIINATRALLSGDFSSDTVRGVNKMSKKRWYEKCWQDKEWEKTKKKKINKTRTLDSAWTETGDMSSFISWKYFCRIDGIGY